MTPERWSRVFELVDAAIGRHESQRASFLREACGGDEALRQDVISLLDQRGRADAFLEPPAFEAVVSALAQDETQARSQPRPLPADRVSHPRVPWWVHLLAGSFIGYFALVTFSVYYLPLAAGVQFRARETDRLIVASVTVGSDADLAGVQPGDRLEAIDGQRLRTLRDYRAFTASAREGEAQTYLFERSGRRFSAPVTPRRRPRSAALQFLPIYAGLFTSLVLALVVAYSRPDNRVARVGALLLASMACAAAPNWPTGLAGTWRHLPILLGALLWPACLSTTAIGPIAFALFALFPRPIIGRRWIWIATLIPGAIVTAWAGAYLMLVVYQPERAAGFYLPGWFTIAAPLSFPAYFAVGLAILVSSYRQSGDLTERRRVRVLLWGMAAAAVGMLRYVVFDVVLADRGWWFGFLEPTRLIGGLLFVALPFCFAYAIVAQRLFDIRLLVRQGLRYALARRSIVSIIPALVAGLLVDLALHAEQPLTDIMRKRGWAYVILAGAAAAAYRYRDSWMESLDRRFFRERYDARQILAQVLKDVVEVGRLDEVAAMVVTRTTAAFHASFAALLLSEPHQRDFHVVAVAPAGTSVPRLTRDSTLVGLVRVMGQPVAFSNARDWLIDQLSTEDAAAIRAADIDLVAPIVTATIDRREALLVFGAKRSEEPYGRDDREFVTTVADSLALLLQPADADDAFAECPQCGTCHAKQTTRCPEDGTPLVRVAVPRVLNGRYTIERRLGRGGMGSVYQAHDGALERQVAVKVIRDDMITSTEAADRFQREARVAASFTHPNVAAVHDFGVAGNGRGYLVMELLIGTTLRAALDRDHRFTPARTLDVLRGVCHAVDAAHRHHLVHRDLKPDNIFLTTEEGPKVVDFGVARSVHAASAALTATGVVVGTFGYMAPEQFRGGTPQLSWDIWALAVVAYEMLTGEHPFTESGGGAAIMPTQTWIRLSDRQRELPRSLDALFARAFSPDPAERPFDALVLLRDLERALEAT